MNPVTAMNDRTIDRMVKPCHFRADTVVIPTALVQNPQDFSRSGRVSPPLNNRYPRDFDQEPTRL